MATLTDYKGLDVVEGATGDGGIALTDNFKALADRAPYQSASNPTTSSDSTAGFAAGDQWLNTSTQVLWACVDASSGAAIWKSLFKRTSTAPQLIPNESSEQVEVQGNLKVSGTDNSSIAGKLGIGTTSPDAQLAVYGRNGSVYIDIASGASTSSYPGLRIYGYAATGQGVVLLYRARSGDSAPSAVQAGDSLGTLGFRGYLSDGFSTQNSAQIIAYAEEDFSDSSRSARLTFGTAPTGGSSAVERMRITGAGDVGIGTTAPKARLHSTDSTILGAASSANANGDLDNNQVNIWVDESSDLLMFKVKYSNGTVKNGSVALS